MLSKPRFQNRSLFRHRQHRLNIQLPTQPVPVETPFTAEEIDTVPDEVVDGWVNGYLAGLSGSELAQIAEAVDMTADQLGYLGGKGKKRRKAAARLREQALERGRIQSGVTSKVSKLIAASAAEQAAKTQEIITKALADRAAADEAKAAADKAAAEAKTQAEADKAKAAADQAQAVKDAAENAVKAALATQAAAPGAALAPSAPVALLPEAPPAYAPGPSYTPPPTGLPPELEEVFTADAGDAGDAGDDSDRSDLPAGLQGTLGEYLGLLYAAPAGPVSVELKPASSTAPFGPSAPMSTTTKLGVAAGAAIAGYFLWKKYGHRAGEQGRLF